MPMLRRRIRRRLPMRILIFGFILYVICSSVALFTLYTHAEAAVGTSAGGGENVGAGELIAISAVIAAVIAIIAVIVLVVPRFRKKK